MINWTNEDVKLVERFVEIRKKGFYVDSQQLTNTYNRILGKHVANTTCGSCLSQRVRELEAALNQFKRQVENIENKAESEPKESTSLVEGATDRMAKVRAARKKKQNDASEKS